MTSLSTARHNRTAGAEAKAAWCQPYLCDDLCGVLIRSLSPTLAERAATDFPDDGSIFRADSKKDQLSSSRQSKVSEGGPCVPPLAFSS